ncbi:hypothetical protein [Nocardioides bigeumensis]|uniref:DUF4132 domain-containing protein n=1 Tax=Nocardioides bigeumensis TaxID=433657 RepID=A0ABN2Y6V3_9ACTN
MDITDRVRLGEHRARVAASLDALHGFTGYSTAHLKAWPGGAELLALDPDLLVSVALVTTAGLRAWPDAPGEYPAELAVDELLGRTVLGALRGRRLPWTPGDVALLLRASVAGFDQAAVKYALGVAKRFLQDRPGEPFVYDALVDVERVLVETPVHVYQVPELRQRARTLLAAQAPGQLIDLSTIAVADGWGAGARVTFEAAVAEDPALVALLPRLGEVRTVRPTATWTRAVASLVSGSAVAAMLLHDLLASLPTLDLTPARTAGPHDDLDWSASTWLVTPGNAVLLRGAALATAYVDDPELVDSLIPLLGLLVLRGAAQHPERFVTLAQCAPLASGALEALISRHATGDPRATEQLRLLSEELTRRDLLKRVHAALGTDPVAAGEQDVRVAEEKRRVQARQANPLPRRQRADLVRLVRAEVAPALREAGFENVRGMTFVRTLDRHQDAVVIGVDDGLADVRVGLRRGPFPQEDAPRVHELEETAILTGGAGHGALWDLGLGLAPDAAAAVRLREALVSRALPWLAVRATQPAPATRSYEWDEL